MKRLLMIVLAVVLTACYSTPPTAVAVPTQFLSPAHTYTPAPTPTIVPSPTPLAPVVTPLLSPPAPVPSATPYPDLQTSGPYLFYLTSPDGYGPLMMVDANAAGRRLLVLPEGGYVYDLQTAPSPDGEWLAFFSGSPETRDLTLHLLNTTDGSVRMVSDLLPPDYPDNFEAAFASLKRRDPQGYFASDELQTTFLQGIHSLEWSPNGRYLAFASGKAGPSSDLYVYDLRAGQVRRLTGGLANIQWLDWSPGSEWIFHASEFGISAGCSATLHAARFDGSQVKDFDECAYGGEWSGDTIYTIHSSANGIGSHNLRNIDVVRGTSAYVWPEQFSGLAYDPQMDMLAVSTFFHYRNMPYRDGTPSPYSEPGLYLVDKEGTLRQVSNQVFVEITYRNGPRDRFVVQDGGQLFGLSAQGDLTLLEENAGWVDISPDYRWMLVYTERQIDLYEADDTLLHTLDLRSLTPGWPDPPLWRPDSQGFFFVASNRLYYVDLPAGEPVLVDPDLPETYRVGPPESPFGWLLRR